MTELKTLKDIEGMDKEEFKGFNEWVHCDELRLEAIKWVKELIGKHQVVMSITPTEATLIMLNKYNYLKEWIMHFFNIEEGELK